MLPSGKRRGSTNAPAAMCARIAASIARATTSEQSRVDSCVCFACGGSRRHTPRDGCTGCYCDQYKRVHPGDNRIRVKVFEYPEGVKDVDEVLSKLGADAFAQMLATARPHTSWVIQHVDSFGPTLETPEGQQEAAELLLEMLACLPVIERAARVKEFAQRCGITEDLLRRALNEIYAKRYPQRHKPRKLASMVIP